MSNQESLSLIMSYAEDRGDDYACPSRAQTASVSAFTLSNVCHKELTPSPFDAALFHETNDLRIFQCVEGTDAEVGTNKSNRAPQKKKKVDNVEHFRVKFRFS
jgi:hypothetical protein